VITNATVIQNSGTKVLQYSIYNMIIDSFYDFYFRFIPALGTQLGS